MQEFNPSDLKTILHSKRANLYYLEHCRILVKQGRVEYVTDAGKQSAYWNIPIANTTAIMLGTGTSITQMAMRKLAQAGVLVGFCGGGGTPLVMATEVELDVAWLQPQSEYRPTEYLQRWVSFWFDETGRLAAAKHIQQSRLARIQTAWPALATQRNSFDPDSAKLATLISASAIAVTHARDTAALLQEEARLTKQLYRLAGNAVQMPDFSRAKRGSGTDRANAFLDHGNYLAYGLAATATWVLGLPHGLAVLHGKTRRGGLVFDVADLIKDSLVLPQAFVSAMRGDSEQEFRQACLNAFANTEALDFMIDTVKEIAQSHGSCR